MENIEQQISYGKYYCYDCDEVFDDPQNIDIHKTCKVFVRTLGTTSKPSLGTWRILITKLMDLGFFPV